MVIITKSSDTSQPKPKCAAIYCVANEPQAIISSKSWENNESDGGSNELILNELQNPPRRPADILLPIIIAHTHLSIYKFTAK